MQLELVTPEKVVFSEEVDLVTVATTTGEITILPKHANLLTKLEPGEMTVKSKGKEQFVAVTGGFLEVANDKITILADYAVRSQDIEVAKAMEAQKRAEETLKQRQEQISERDLALAQADMRKAILELKVVRRRHRSSIPGSQT